MKSKRIMWICESAIMVAVGTVLSMIPLINMPFGGSVTAASMVPVILIAYRYGLGLGSVTGLVYSLIQLLLGANNLSYATSAGAAVAIILLDYVLAFTALGLVGVFKDKLNSQAGDMVLGTVMVCAIRYIMHVISGCTVWAGVSIPTEEGLLYSLVYNAAYMVPETIVTIAAVWYLSRIIDFRGEKLTRMQKSDGNKSSVLNAVSALLLIGAATFDALMLFASTQTEEGFNIVGIASAPFGLMGIVTASLVAISLVLYWIGKKCKK